jgi:hypothetical protein
MEQPVVEIRTVMNAGPEYSASPQPFDGYAHIGLKRPYGIVTRIDQATQPAGA